MNLNDQIVINAPPEKIWPFVADPQQMKQWSLKLATVDRHISGPVRAGERFKATYRMGKDDRPTDVTVAVCEPPRLLELRHQMFHKDRQITAIERYDLQSQPDGSTLFKQTIDLSQAGIPWFFRAIIFLISRFGESQGQTYLQRLKKIVEQLPENAPALK